MIMFVSIFLYHTEGVVNHPIQLQGSPIVIFSLSTLLNISKLIDEANRCPSQTENGLCSWTWVHDIEETRIPRIIYKAEKLADSPCERDPNKECRSERKQFDVMYLTQNSLGVYQLLPHVEELPVAMVCANKQTEYVVVNSEDVDYNVFD